MSHHSTNSFEFVDMTGHISPIGVADGFDEGFEGFFTLLGKPFISNYLVDISLLPIHSKLRLW
jgi:hypothetical protein